MERRTIFLIFTIVALGMYCVSLSHYLTELQTRQTNLQDSLTTRYSENDKLRQFDTQSQSEIEILLRERSQLQQQLENQVDKSRKLESEMREKQVLAETLEHQITDLQSKNDEISQSIAQVQEDHQHEISSKTSCSDWQTDLQTEKSQAANTKLAITADLKSKQEAISNSQNTKRDLELQLTELRDQMKSLGIY
eukprot:TRINITY_DN5210_c0_g1::TRINITY_DN5210_c0_g1_i1::g.23502::m.23502 TRINITY_DN5210_c0_g1::TRINITY_DN5210_c0_g1_i1::g.23502  ORF type:complete len:217 (+),score=9.96,DUF4164/PF13747.1/0.0012,DUF4164/PF13747.1/2e+02,DUF4164/PF13747.1/1.2e+03,IncA/PF04156.9/0.078,Rab5-bind/PF09311.6/0.0073,cwf21/PF08312.7/8.5e+03,cwf21/PF08312.7/0.22,Myosin_tail_1/PF01576.14/0.42,FUSC/PF04632.7/1,HlyD/PF00529.15/1.1,Tetraspannin/PF00335.15/6.1,DUF641/PF04859.7/0.34,DUF641/PF04859.7/65,RNaseH_C/PF09293.5/3.2,RNaseH_C/PF